jgi:hypothetical protein
MPRTASDFIRLLKYRYELAVLRLLYEREDYKATQVDLQGTTGQIESLGSINPAVIGDTRNFLEENEFIVVKEEGGRIQHMLTAKGYQIAESLANITESIEQGMNWSNDPARQ